jgi:uncharacterized damage-inducible protein DinB
MIAEDVAFPDPTTFVGSRAAVLLGYLDFYRSRLVAKLRCLPEEALRSSSLPSGWSPLELTNHLRFVERRWLEWGFEGQPVDQPWGDSRDGRWYVAPGRSREDVIGALSQQAEQTRLIVEAHTLADIGLPSPRWDGRPPASLERILLHLLQEYARHIGQLDIVVELAGGDVGE